MDLQLHSILHLAISAHGVQASRRIRMVRRLVSHWLGLGTFVRTGDESPYIRRTGSGLLSADVEACVLPPEGGCTHVQGQGAETKVAAYAEILAGR